MKNVKTVKIDKELFNLVKSAIAKNESRKELNTILVKNNVIAATDGSVLIEIKGKEKIIDVPFLADPVGNNLLTETEKDITAESYPKYERCYNTENRKNETKAKIYIAELNSLVCWCTENKIALAYYAKEKFIKSLIKLGASWILSIHNSDSLLMTTEYKESKITVLLMGLKMI